MTDNLKNTIHHVTEQLSLITGWSRPIRKYHGVLVGASDDNHKDEYALISKPIHKSLRKRQGWKLDILKEWKGQGQGTAKTLVVGCTRNVPQSNEQLKQFADIVASPGSKS